MKVSIENGKLKQASSLLLNLSLAGKKSRHRTKFITKMQDRLKEVEEQRQVLAKEHSHLDDEGKPKTIGDKFDIKDMEAFKKDLEELYKEELVIDGGDAQGMLKTVKTVLLDCEKEWQGEEALIYDYLCDQFENGDDQ
ncbi:DUF1617 family protein [Salipaludibacillus sp. HK11]|uniref:DUF1617 family protein n=1 Tax=Salipaludibacillus sp. HK11 TaxID=3394320 RepID=UPI0039FBAE57